MRRFLVEKDLGLAALFFVLAAGVAVLVSSHPDWKGEVRGFLVLGALGLGFIGVLFVLAAADQFYSRHLFNQQEINKLEASCTESAIVYEAKVKYLQYLSSLSDRVLNALIADPALARVIAGDLGPLPALATKEGDVPYHIIDLFFTANEEREVCVPESRWATAGRTQYYIGVLMRHLIHEGYLVTWAGQNTARWATDDACARAVRYCYGDRIKRTFVADRDLTKDAEPETDDQKYAPGPVMPGVSREIGR